MHIKNRLEERSQRGTNSISYGHTYMFQQNQLPEGSWFFVFASENLAIYYFSITINSTITN